MSDARSIEELTAMYTKQSVNEFLSTATAAPAKNDGSGESPEYVTKGCNWPCCNEEGECKPVCWICLAVCAVGAVICCCYLTNGFDGRWTYWPF